MRVFVEVEEVVLEGDYGDVGVPGVRVVCSLCDHEVEVFGTDGPSIRRGCVMLREECPKGASNWYAEPPTDAVSVWPSY